MARPSTGVKVNHLRLVRIARAGIWRVRKPAQRLIPTLVVLIVVCSGLVSCSGIDVLVKPLAPASQSLQNTPKASTDLPQDKVLSPPSINLRPSNDTGVSNKDNLTGNNMPTFEGYASVEATVEVYDGTAKLGTSAVDSRGYWAFGIDVSTGLNDGAHSITAKAIGPNGRESASSRILAVTIDTNPPAIPSIRSVTEVGPTASGQVTINGTATPNIVVTVLDGRVPLATTTSDPSGTWSLSLTGISGGSHSFRTSATSAAGVTSVAGDPTTVTIASAPGVATSTPLAQSSPGFTSPVVAAAAGDIACDSTNSNLAENCQQQATANLVAAIRPDLVLPLGDNQYECGSLSAFQQYYGPSWGKFLSTTHPAVGNHDYRSDIGTSESCSKVSPDASGYFSYFGNEATPNQPGCTTKCQGYYSYDAGAWHIVVLNSVCDEVGGCGLGSPQEVWLKNDLAAHPNVCTLAYWHYPRYTSGLSGATFVNGLKIIWQDLYNAGVDLVVNGHDHDYERFAPMDVNGNLDPAHGLREIVVGTGGKSHHPITSLIPNSESHNSDTFGVLKLTLSDGSYAWQFLPIAGKSFTDSGSQNCNP